MMNMEFVDMDYSVLLDYQGQSTEAAGAKETNNQLASETTGETSRQAEEKAKWTFGYCQQFFDVTTKEVLNRIWQSVKPLPSADFMTDVLQNKPDLYGPIWICITLALEFGLTSDMAYYLQLSTDRPWRLSVKAVYRASVLLFLYSWCLPAVIWIVLEWNPISEIKYKLTDLLCVYGYASAILVPVAALWVMPFPWVRWVSALTATFISGILICRSLKKAFVKLDRCGYYAIQILLFTLNVMVGISINLLIFPSNHHHHATAHESTLTPNPFFNESNEDITTISTVHAIYSTLLNNTVNNVTKYPYPHALQNVTI